MYKVITVGREFGSAGKAIGKAVAEKLGYAYYDEELIRQVADETGFSENFVENEGGYNPGKKWLNYILASRGPEGIINGMSVDDYLWAVQKKVILESAEKGPCVIVGHNADYILKDRDDCLNIFIHAGINDRKERIMKHHGGLTEKPERMLYKKDKNRKVYYKYFTGQEWGMSQNYHITLNQGVIGIEKCVDIIVDLAKGGPYQYSAVTQKKY
jgi:cytidylate kinase